VRLLTVVSDFRPGGTQRVACNFAFGYARSGLSSAVFAHRGGGALEETLRGQGIELFIGAAEENGLRKALQRALEWRPDVIHIHREGPSDPRTGSIMRAARSSRRYGTSAPVGIVETNVFGRVDHSSDAQYIDVHFLLSKWCLWKWRQWSSAMQPVPLGVVLPNLVMHEEFYPVAAEARAHFRQQCSIPQDALLFGRVGSPIESKWSNITLEAFEAYARTNHKAWLLLVGISNELRAAVHALPTPVRQRIVIIDFLNGNQALREAYSAMDVFLHASRIGESFGMVLAESLCCQRPVITLSTPVRDNSQLEVVGHEKGGLAVASATAMIEAMQRLENAALREQYATRGAAHIIQQFGPETLLPKAIAIAELVAEGLPRAQLARRLLAIPETCMEVSGQEIRALMRHCLGQYPSVTPTLLKLVSNPFLYRAYRAVTR